MIGIKNFGWRLGNQLFQIATLISLARENNDVPAFPEWDYAQHLEGNFPVTEFNSMFTYREQGFHYNKIPYQKGLGIEGYFQSWKHFVEHEQEVIDALTPTLTADYIDEYGDVCAIHVRRGDYLTLPDHHPVFPCGR